MHKIFDPKFGERLRWLRKNYIHNLTQEDPGFQAAEIKPIYDPHGGWKPQIQDDDHKLLGQAFEILRSDTIYRAALVNIVQIYHASQAASAELRNARRDLADRISENEILKGRIKHLQQQLIILELKGRDELDAARIRRDDPPEKKEELIKLRSGIN